MILPESNAMPDSCIHEKLPLLEGKHQPMGALVSDTGVNFAVFSDHAHRIELCVFDASGELELWRHDLHGPDNGIFHGFLVGARAGLVYGYRAHGPYRPDEGHRFNAHKLLLDPYAREIVGRFEWHPEHNGYVLHDPDGPRSFDVRDNARTALKARVPTLLEPAETAMRPRIPEAEVVLYEVHVKGFSQLHPDIPDELRGSYAALAHPVAIAHFRSLGVTSLSLLPVHYRLDEPGLAERGLSNYWGYNTLGFFCPDPRLAANDETPSAVNREFRDMVAELHRNGIEVVLDVVFNHTAEGSETGPTLSFRGLDNASWYHLARDDRSRCENISGCGNTVNVAHTRVTQFVLDSLRYWVVEMGVDGFRFDLAPVLGRTASGFHAHSAFFTALQQDPVLAGVHLIAEPWDGGFDGYQVGRFPGRFLEWNDKFRDVVRACWLKNTSGRGEIARRMLASSDLFHHRQRQPLASVNFVTAHDGFTLRDMVSYSHKRNLANGEANRDGRDDELCENFGLDGPTDNTTILAARRRATRAMLANLLLAQGTPMLCAGDEIGKTQAGNNNAYCQDSSVSWLDWNDADMDLMAFVSRVIAIRRDEPLLRNSHWFERTGGHRKGFNAHWLRQDGRELSEGDWHDPENRMLACLLAQSTNKPGSNRVLIVVNPESVEQEFVLPPGGWFLALDSSGESTLPTTVPLYLAIGIPATALMLFRHIESSH